MAGAVRPLGPVGGATDGLLLLQPTARTRLRATSDTAFFQSFKADSFVAGVPRLC